MRHVLRLLMLLLLAATNGEPANADLTTVTQDMPISCRDHIFPDGAAPGGRGQA